MVRLRAFQWYMTCLYRHVIYRWKALDLSILMALIYPARYLPMTFNSLKFPVTNISCFTESISLKDVRFVWNGRSMNSWDLYFRHATKTSTYKIELNVAKEEILVSALESSDHEKTINAKGLVAEFKPGSTIKMMLKPKKVREHPFLSTDFKIRTMFGLGWVGG